MARVRGNKREAARILLRAAKLLERYGWIQGAATDGVHYCAWGAINKVAGSYRHTATNKRAKRAMVKTVGGRIATFNDKPGRTAEQVAAALRKAAKRV